MSDNDFIKITRECRSMAVAAKMTGMSYRSFRKKAIKLGCFNPNQSGEGIPKSNGNKIPLEEILEGKQPQYKSYKLKIRLIEEEVISDECSICGWSKKPVGAKYSPCELDHIDGNPLNHKLDNIRILCPNCHSLTKTYRFRRGKTNGIEHLEVKTLE